MIRLASHGLIPLDRLSACQVPVTVIPADLKATKLRVTTNLFGRRYGVETKRPAETSYGDAPIARLKDPGQARSTP